MIEKYKIHLRHEGTIGLIFNDEKNIATIGGNKRFRLKMIEILEDFFGCTTLPEPNEIQTNKIRYSVKCTLSKFYKIIKELKEFDQVFVESVKSLDRLMR